jgi:hypothetical protein
VAGLLLASCRYDVGVLEHCGKDVDRLCADAKNRVHGNATVLKCLAENFAQTGAAKAGMVTCSLHTCCVRVYQRCLPAQRRSCCGAFQGRLSQVCRQPA